MSNKRVFKFLALSLAFTFAGVLSAPAEVLLSETWDVAIDSLKWATEARPAASQGAGQVSLTETEDVGGGDYAAYTEGPSDWNWGQELETVDTFARGNNLRCTFTTWYDPTASYPSAAPGGSAINGPFHSASMMGGNQSHSALEAAVGREYGSFLFEQASWGGGPAISAAFHVAYASATSKANAVKIKVTLGDASGAMLQWSNDSGYSWTTEYDTRGVSGPTNSPVYVGFGTNHGQIFYDDIIVENDVVVETLLSETWDVAIDPLTWATEARPAGSQGAGQASLAETEDVGGGDFAAYTEGPSDWGWGQELVTVGTFPRGDNLICTFTTWYDPTANYSGAAPGGSAINGPFHNDTVIGGNQTHTNSEAMASYEYQNSMRFDQDDSWGGERGLPSGPVLSASFHAAYAAATSKANGLKIKVTLGNASGAMFEWWDQGGTRYLEADNRGEVASPTKSVGSAPDVYVGWGTHHGQIFYDDITVTTDVPNPNLEDIPGVVLSTSNSPTASFQSEYNAIDNLVTGVGDDWVGCIVPCGPVGSPDYWQIAWPSPVSVVYIEINHDASTPPESFQIESWNGASWDVHDVYPTQTPGGGETTIHRNGGMSVADFPASTTGIRVNITASHPANWARFIEITILDALNAPRGVKTWYVSGGGSELVDTWNNASVLAGDIIEITDSLTYTTSAGIASYAGADDGILIRASSGQNPTFQSGHTFYVNAPFQFGDITGGAIDIIADGLFTFQVNGTPGGEFRLENCNVTGGTSNDLVVNVNGLVTPATATVQSCNISGITANGDGALTLSAQNSDATPTHRLNVIDTVLDDCVRPFNCRGRTAGPHLGGALSELNVTNCRITNSAFRAFNITVDDRAAIFRMTDSWFIGTTGNAIGVNDGLIDLTGSVIGMEVGGARCVRLYNNSTAVIDHCDLYSGNSRSVQADANFTGSVTVTNSNLFADPTYAAHPNLQNLGGGTSVSDYNNAQNGYGVGFSAGINDVTPAVDPLFVTGSPTFDDLTVQAPELSNAASDAGDIGSGLIWIPGVLSIEDWKQY